MAGGFDQLWIEQRLRGGIGIAGDSHQLPCAAGAVDNRHGPGAGRHLVRFRRSSRSIGLRGGCAVVAGMLLAIPVAVPRADRGRRYLCRHHGDGFAAQRVSKEAAQATTTTPESPNAPASNWAQIRAASAAAFACPGRGARSGRLPRRKIPANHYASLARVVSVTVLSRQAWRRLKAQKATGAALQPPPQMAKRKYCDQFGTGALALGGKAELTWMPRRRSNAMLSALSFLASGGI
jgi:hypothetical protein